MTSKDKENTENEDMQEDIQEEVTEGNTESTDEAEVTLSKEEYDALLKKIEELEGMKDRLLRTAADYENAKKRLVKEKEDFLKFASERLISDLLPSLDNLNRAIETAEKDNPDDPILKGIHLTEKGVFDVLGKHGLTRVEALDQPFSVEFHEALGQVETSEKEEGTVVEELEAGYMLYGKLIRPARVKIAKAPEAATDDSEEEE